MASSQWDVTTPTLKAFPDFIKSHQSLPVRSSHKNWHSRDPTSAPCRRRHTRSTSEKRHLNPTAPGSSSRPSRAKEQVGSRTRRTSQTDLRQSFSSLSPIVTMTGESGSSLIFSEDNKQPTNVETTTLPSMESVKRRLNLYFGCAFFTQRYP